MYRPKHFEMTDNDALDAIVEYPFAALITTSAGAMTVSHLPIWLHRGEGALYGHLARANPHWRALEAAEDLMLLFTGPHGYISPGWYTDPADVPTWNYVVAAVHGRATLLPDEDDTKLLLSRLSAQHEARFVKPWTNDKLPDTKLAAMLRAIVAFRVDIQRIEAKAKLGQNRRAADLTGAIVGLRASTSPSADHALADAMQFALDGVTASQRS